ncbi:MAG TPA: ATP-binding protein [Gemmatimonadales bacterium]|nr:ATP-binding protein [Gemmatimonadales bacterium]
MPLPWSVLPQLSWPAVPGPGWWAVTAGAVVVAVGVTVGVSQWRLTRRGMVAARAREQSAQERTFSAQMLESVPGVVYLYDATGRFLRWNERFLQVTGYSADELARMHPIDFFRGADIPRLEERIAAVFTEGEASVEAEFVAKDGTAIPYLFTGRRITWEGQPCLIGVGVDIREQRAAEQALRESELRYHATLDRLSEGCQIFSPEWEILYLNDAAAEHNRAPRAELLGRTLLDVWPGIEQTDIFALLEGAMRARVARHAELPFTFPDGTVRWFDIRCQPIPEGLFALSIDVTQRKQVEFALAEVREGLERTVAERTADLQRALVRAEAADRLKSAFLATMSHELRTPLNSILGFTGLLLQRLPGPLLPEQDRQLGMVRASARHLLDLINDVLDISKIEAGELQVRPAAFDFPALLRHAIEVVRPTAEAKGLALHVDILDAPAELVSDRRRVEQILLNLLNNAVKFTDQGEVALRVTRGLPGDAGAPWVTCEVRDTGIGIPATALPELFQPFRQVDTGLSRQHEGTGLGLAISRRLAGLLGGGISAESTVGQGSRFVVTVPLAPTKDTA